VPGGRGLMNAEVGKNLNAKIAKIAKGEGMMRDEAI
jgi:hypothetical protein